MLVAASRAKTSSTRNGKERIGVYLKAHVLAERHSQSGLSPAHSRRLDQHDASGGRVSVSVVIVDTRLEDYGLMLMVAQNMTQVPAEKALEPSTDGAHPVVVAGALQPGAHASGGFFFFQAEDGIRDLIVTGVQTCALPI